MEISALDKALPFNFIMTDKDGMGNVPPVAQDFVDISAPQLLADDEVDDVLDATIDMLARDNVAALSVHGGLTQSRVFSLLGL